MCRLNLSTSGYTPVAGLCVHDRRRISGASDYWTVEDSASWRELDCSTLLTRDVTCTKRQPYTKRDNKCPLRVFFFTIKFQSTKFSRSSQPLFQHADSQNSYKRKGLVEFQQLALFDASVFALFVIGLDCHFLVARKLFHVREYLIGLI